MIFQQYHARRALMFLDKRFGVFANLLREPQAGIGVRDENRSYVAADDFVRENPLGAEFTGAGANKARCSPLAHGYGQHNKCPANSKARHETTPPRTVFLPSSPLLIPSIGCPPRRRPARFHPAFEAIYQICIQPRPARSTWQIAAAGFD